MKGSLETGYLDISPSPYEAGINEELRADGLSNDVAGTRLKRGIELLGNVLLSVEGRYYC